MNFFEKSDELEDKYKAKWMFADSRSQSKNWRMIAELIKKFIESGELKLDIEFTAPDIENLKEKNGKLRELLKRALDAMEKYEYCTGETVMIGNDKYKPDEGQLARITRKEIQKELDEMGG